MAVEQRHGLGAPLVALLVAGCAAAIGLLWQRALGDTGFPTHPAGVLGLLGGAVVAAAASSRLSGSARRGVALARLFVLSLVLYLASAWWAVVAWPDHGTARPAVATWGAAWVPPLLLVQLTASSVVRRGPRPPYSHVVVIVLLALTAVHALLLVAPARPFVGLPAFAPEAWVVSLRPWGDLVPVVGLVSLVLLPALLWRAALTSVDQERARLGLAAVGASTAPVVVLFGLLLAVARHPSGVSPEMGSAAFLAALGAGTAWGSWCAVLAGEQSTRGLVAAVRVLAASAAGLVVLGVGTLLAAPGAGVAPGVEVVVLASVVLAAVVAVRQGSHVLTRTLLRAPQARVAPGSSRATPSMPDPRPTAGPAPDPAPETAAGPAPDEAPGSAPSPAPVQRSGSGVDHEAVRRPPPGGVPALTTREHEVLALLAAGASNAGIATRLVVSQRTVDAHLRSVLAKLGLEPGADVPSRVQAARWWLASRSVGVSDGRGPHG